MLAALAKSHFLRMAHQLVDSDLRSTRVFWRKKLGYSDYIANDPRPLAEVIS